MVAAHRPETGQADPQLARRRPGCQREVIGRRLPRRSGARRRSRAGAALGPRWRPTAARTASITWSCSASVRPGNIGRASVRAAARVGHRQVGVEAALHDVALAMDRDRVVDVGPDAGLAEVGDDRVARPADVERVLVEDVGPAVRA